jgi:hypothetical protein
MSKTYKDVVKLFDTTKAKKRESKASARFKTERKRRDERKLYAFTTWLERTAPKD